MKPHLFTLAFAAILGLVLVATPVIAQTPPPTPTPKPVKTAKASSASKIAYKGTLTALDATSITVQTKTVPLTLVLSPTTKFRKDKLTATLADFAVGDTVSGSYTKDAKSGTLTAYSLHKKTLTAPAPAPASAH